MTGRAATMRFVCVPGLGLSDGAWRPTMDALSATERPVVMTLPGLGDRPTAQDDLRPTALAARLVEDLTAEPVPVVLLGHSASCHVVVRAAAMVPDRVAALVLVGPSTDPRAASWPGLVVRWLRTAVRERPTQVPFLARSWSRTGPVWMVRTMNAARRDDLRVNLPAVGCPVLVVRGPRDHISPADWGRALASIAPPGSRAVTLAQGAHMVPLTHGDLLASAVRDFLDAR